nr:hypothetical protein [Desulfobacterales bacterium]
VQDCIADAPTCFGSGISGDYNISSDTTAPGSNSLINQDPYDLFVDPDSGDYSLKSGSNAIDAGTDLSAEMDSVDIAGTSRPQGSAWDIGAFEYVSSGTTYNQSVAGSLGIPSGSLGETVTFSESLGGAI